MVKKKRKGTTMLKNNKVYGNTCSIGVSNPGTILRANVFTDCTIIDSQGPILMADLSVSEWLGCTNVLEGLLHSLLEPVVEEVSQESDGVISSICEPERDTVK